jgi:peptidoglycan/xylan/chitin deacetylase (PgdA/CDA1 family)
MRKVFFTTSWDDGSIYDIKLSSILLKYNVKGTFYIPLKNKEVDATLSREEIKMISKDFEIGGHTFHHTVLPHLSLEKAEEEIISCKNALEDIICKEINAFCFPRGKYTHSLVKLVKKCGFMFSRTTIPLRIKNLIDIRTGLMHVSLQVFPHKHYVYWLSIMRGNWEGLSNYFRFLDVVNNWKRLAEKLFDYAFEGGKAFHLWGHSWEIEKYNLWDFLEHFLKYINKRNDVVFCTNTEFWRILNENR